jgi:hypothetical protein
MVAPQTRLRIRHALVRYRRPLAAGCAAAAVLLIMTSLRAPSSTTTPPASERSGGEATTFTESIDHGLVASPVRLADADVATLLHPGSLVDVLAADGKGNAFVVADAVEVITIPTNENSSLGPTGFGGALVVLAVSATEATELAATSAVGPLSIVLVG